MTKVPRSDTLAGAARPARRANETGMTVDMANVQRTFDDAVAALNRRNLVEAERLFKDVLRKEKKHVPSLNLLTVVLMNMERFQEAEEFIARAVKLNPNSDVSFYNYGLISKRLKKPQQALEQFDKALRLKKNVPETWNNRGTILNDLKRYQEAIADFDQAIALAPNYAEACANRAKSLFELKRYDEAAAAYDKALTLRPDLAEAWLGRGNIYTERKRYDEAFAAYDKALALKPDLVEAWLGRGKTFADAERYEEAHAAYDKALALSPDSAEAWLGSGNVLAKLERYDAALSAYDRALGLKPDLESAWVGRGGVYTKLKRYDDALAAYDEALVLQPDFELAWLGRGGVLTELKRYDDALADYDEALAHKPESEWAWLGRGHVFCGLKRSDEAFAAYDKALALKPDLAEAWFGRGNVLIGLKRYDEALAAYDQALALKPDLAEALLGRGNAFICLKRYEQALAACDDALLLKPDLAEAWLGRGNVLYGLKRHDEALAAYDKALAIKPDLEGAWFARGNVFNEFKQFEEAFAAYSRALILKPDLAEAWLGRGGVFHALKRNDEALAAYDKALELKPDFEAAWFGRGNILTDFKRYDEAFAAYDKAFVLDPNLTAVEAVRLHSKMHCCAWDDFDKESEHLLASAVSKKESALPWVLLSIDASAQQQLDYARFWAAKNFPAPVSPIWTGEIYNNKRIRIGYISSDFRRHAVPYLMAGIFENHDRQRFETFALSTGDDDKSAMRNRLAQAFDQFVDVGSKSDQDIAEQIRALNVDILVDLTGYTTDSRSAGILARRPAPVQAAYLGYAGTTGAEFVDYLIADRTVIPPSQQMHYAEKIVYLPHCFMPHDAEGRQISDKPVARSDFGLPENGIVFCCFNNAYKLNPHVFRSWMTIMKAVGGSVLWLSELHETAQRNLQSQAQAAGVDASRLVFAKRLNSAAEHLARHQLADLFLDTVPYNAHTTASDALWAGLPVLTVAGETFAARVAASLLNAVGLPELIARSKAEYEKLAIELANNPDRLEKIKQKLKTKRLASPLFDTRLFTRHLEAAYEAMYDRYQAGLAPDHILVAETEGPTAAAAGSLVVSEVA